MQQAHKPKEGDPSAFIKAWAGYSLTTITPANTTRIQGQPMYKLPKRNILSKSANENLKSIKHSINKISAITNKCHKQC